MSEKIRASSIGVWLAAGAIFHDYVPFPEIHILSLAKIMFALALPFLASAGFSARFSRLSFSVLLYSLLLVVGSMLFGTGGISDRTVAVSFSLIIGFISFFFVSQAKVSPKRVVRAFEFWVILSSALGIFQAVTGTGFVSDRFFEAYIIPGVFRASGFTDDPNYFALLCLMGFALSASPDARHPKLLAVMALIAVVLSGSRAGMITAVLLVLINRAGGFFSIPRVLLLASLVAAVAALLITFKDKLPEGFAEMLDPSSYSLSEGGNSLSFRMAALVSGIRVFLENPLFGYGLGNNVYHPFNFLGLVSHNTFVETAAESGIFGLLLYFNVLYHTAKAATSPQAKRRPETKLVISMLLASMILMSFTLVTEYSRIFFFFLVLVAVLTRGELPLRQWRSAARFPSLTEGVRG